MKKIITLMLLLCFHLPVMAVLPEPGGEPDQPPAVCPPELPVCGCENRYQAAIRCGGDRCGFGGDGVNKGTDREGLGATNNEQLTTNNEGRGRSKVPRAESPKPAKPVNNEQLTVNNEKTTPKVEPTPTPTPTPEPEPEPEVVTLPEPEPTSEPEPEPTPTAEPEPEPELELVPRLSSTFLSVNSEQLTTNNEEVTVSDEQATVSEQITVREAQAVTHFASVEVVGEVVVPRLVKAVSYTNYTPAHVPVAVVASVPAAVSVPGEPVSDIWLTVLVALCAGVITPLVGFVSKRRAK